MEDEDELGQVSTFDGELFYTSKKDGNFKYHQQAIRQLELISAHANTTVPEFIDQRFRENKPTTLVFSH